MTIRQIGLASSNYLASLTRYSDLFLSSLKNEYPKHVIVGGLAISVVAFAIFGQLTPNALVNGDAAVYAQQIESLDFASRTTHMGYYLLGATFLRLIPLQNDLSLNLMSCFFGALSASLVYFIGYTITGKSLVALIAGVLIMTNYLFIFNSLFAEVYIVQTFFLLLATQLWLWNYGLLTALAFAVSFTITPSSLIAFPFFVVLKPQVKPLVLMAISALLVILVVLLPHFEDFLFGGRGLINAVGDSMSIGKRIGKEGSEIFYGFFLYIPLMLIGVIELFARESLRVLGVGLLVLGLVNFILAEKYDDVPVQLFTYALMAIVGGIGLDNLMTTKKFRWKSPTMIGIALSLLVVSILFFLRMIRWNNYRYPPMTITNVLLFALALTLIASVIIVRRGNGRLGRARGLMLASVVAFVICVQAVKVFDWVNASNEQIVSYRTLVQDMNKIADPNYIVIGDWNNGILFEHYVLGDSYTGRWVNTESLNGDWGPVWKADSKEQLQKAVADGEEIWLLGNYPEIVKELNSEGYRIEPFRTIYRATSGSNGR